MSHTTLENYLRSNYGLINRHKWDMTYFDSLPIWEANIYLDMLVEDINKAKEDK